VASRLVLFGATGYTGELTARAMARRGLRPVLAGRRRDAVEALAAEIGGLDVAEADAADPGSMSALVDRGDVLVSTAGPFVRWGDSAVNAAIGAGAHYVDLAGEPPFVRRIFEEWDGPARKAGCLLLTAMAYDAVPGNLAGALALRDAGANAKRVRIGCFDDAGPRGMSGGTRLSNLAGMLDPGFAWRGGRIVGERPAARVGSFEVAGGRRRGVSAGTSEAFSLPRLHPGLDRVDVHLGWFGLGRIARPLWAMSAVGAAAARIPGVRRATSSLAHRLARGSGGGPDKDARARHRSLFVAEALDASGARLSRAVLAGGDGYDFSAEMLAWAAEQLLAGSSRGTGARGPAEAFGLERLEAGAAECGLRAVDVPLA
jgi:short subunit dehydrogenase-like uncharacterized protein